MAITPCENGDSPSAGRLDVGHPDDGDALLVGRGEVDLGGDGPVAVARGVVEDLPDEPALRLLGDRDQLRAAGVGAGADRGECRRARRSRAPAPSRQALGVPAGLAVELAEEVPAPQRRQLDPAEQRVAHQHPERADVAGDAAPGTSSSGGGADVPAGPAPAARASHSSSRLESTWRTSSPSHSSTSASSSVLASSGTVWRSAR